MSTRTIAAVIAAVVVIAALAIFVRHEPRPAADATSNDASTPRQAEAPPAERPRTPDTAPTPNDARAADQPGTPLPQSSTPAPITEALDELKLPPIPEIQDTEAAFAAEAVDARWAPEAEAHILGEIAQMTGLKLVTLRVECRTTLCRLHVAQQEVSRANPFPDLVGRVGLKPLWVIATVDRTGVPTSLAYLERESTAPNGKTE